MSENELDVGLLMREPGDVVAIRDAIDAASDQDGVTWLTGNGRRIAAVVPVDLAEYGLRSPWQPPAWRWNARSPRRRRC